MKYNIYIVWNWVWTVKTHKDCKVISKRANTRKWLLDIDHQHGNNWLLAHLVSILFNFSCLWSRVQKELILYEGCVNVDKGHNLGVVFRPKFGSKTC
jgi:hypothetical protein